MLQKAWPSCYTPHKPTHAHTHVHGLIPLTVHTTQVHTLSYTIHTSSHMYPYLRKVPHTCTHHFIHHFHSAHVGTTYNSTGTTWVHLPCHTPHIFNLHSLASPQAPQLTHNTLHIIYTHTHTHTPLYYIFTPKSKHHTHIINTHFSH